MKTYHNKGENLVLDYHTTTNLINRTLNYINGKVKNIIPKVNISFYFKIEYFKYFVNEFF